MFIADSVQPRLGLEKALMSLLDLIPYDQVELVLISGPPPAHAAYPVTTLGQPRGWRGRLRALPALRSIATERAGAGAVIVAAGSWAYAALAAATVISRFKLTLWEHTLVPWRVRHEIRSTIAAAALRLLSFRLQRIVCVSESNAATVARFVWPFKQLTVIPNITAAPDTEQSTPARATNDSSRAVRLVGIGSLSQRKNWELAIRAMKYLPENFSLAIAGGGAQHDCLNELIEELGLSGRVRLLGFVPNAEHLMRTADVVVHPSFAETFGYTMVEAAARQRPIVVVDMPVMNEMVPHFACGERAKPTPKEFAAAIMRAWVSDYRYSDTAVARQSAFNSDSILMSWSNVIGSIPR